MPISLEILDYLAGGGLVVAASSRASRALRHRYAEWQRSLDHRAWPAPQVLDWEGWLDALWQAHLLRVEDAPLVLSSIQERFLWTQLLKSEPEAEQVVSVHEMARLAQQAYSLLSAYNAHGERARSWAWDEDAISDAEAFRRWAGKFEQECRRRRWTTRGNLPLLLSQSVEAGDTQPPAGIRLVGFDSTTPAQAMLIGAMERAGSSVLQLDPAAMACERYALQASDRRTEIGISAQWLRHILESRPGARIAVIVPQVEEVRDELDRTYRRVLQPGSMSLASPAAPLPYEFSLGQPLATLPLVRAALLLLRWPAAPLLDAEIRWLLLSGFAAESDTDWLSLNAADARDRSQRFPSPESSLPSFLNRLARQSTEAGKRLRHRLNTVNIAAQRAGVSGAGKPAGEWADFSSSLLSAAGWPGFSAADSAGFQARRKWSELLDSIATLGFHGSRMTYNDFVAALERHAGESIFSPESLDAPVQIMGPLESSGQDFDAIWFLGANEGAWPAVARPHPLIPLSVQQRAAMPHSSLEQDWTLARAVTNRLAASAPVCVFSYAAQDKDGALQPSPLLLELPAAQPCQAIEDFAASNHLGSEAPFRDYTEIFDDGAPVPWLADRAAGGSNVLKRQSACPFQSFAAGRLGVVETKDAQWGLSPMERGVLLHGVLEHLWSSAPAPGRLHTREDLHQAILEDTLAAMLSQHIDEVFRSQAAGMQEDAWTLAYLETEKRRLHRLLTAWLRYEAGREPFEVEACERELKDVRVGELRLDLRIDRIDKLPGERRLLIDYKTGEVSGKDWRTPRPEEPQLPLYAAYGGLESVCGIAFAQIRAGKAMFHARLTQKDLLLQGNAAEDSLTPETIDDWHDELLRLAEAFLRGDAQADPKNYPATCKYCAFPGLCRIAESDAAARAEGNDAGESEEAATDD